MQPFTYITAVRLVGVVLGIIFIAHLVHEVPWAVIGGAALALLFLP